MRRRRLVTIAGGTSSGKTTLADKLAEMWSDLCTPVEADWYYCHHPEMSLEERQTGNYDHPDAIEDSLLLNDLDHLLLGEDVCTPRYDFSTHLRKKEKILTPSNPIIILNGILVLGNPSIRERSDVKIFVDTDADVRAWRRAEGDMKNRGRTFEQSRDQWLSTVKPMHELFCEPTKRFADLIIPLGGNNPRIHFFMDIIARSLLSIE